MKVSDTYYWHIKKFTIQYNLYNIQFWLSIQLKNGVIAIGIYPFSVIYHYKIQY